MNPHPHQIPQHPQKVLKIPEGELKLDYIQLETWTKNYPELEAWSDIRVRSLDIWQATERLLRHLGTHNHISFPLQSTFGHSLKMLTSDPRFAGNKHFTALVRKMKERLILETRNAVVHGSVMPKLQAVHEALDCYREFLLFSTWKTKPYKAQPAQQAQQGPFRPGPPPFNPQTPAPYLAPPIPSVPVQPPPAARFDATQHLAGQFSNLTLQSKPPPQYPPVYQQTHQQPYQQPFQPPVQPRPLLPPQVPPAHLQYPPPQRLPQNLPPQQLPPLQIPSAGGPYQPTPPFALPHQTGPAVPMPVPSAPSPRQFVAPLTSGLTVLLEAILKHVAVDIVQDSLTEILTTFTALISIAPEARVAELCNEASLLGFAVREALDSRPKPAFLEAYTKLVARVQSIKAQLATL